MPQGICKLCLRWKDLLDSHFIPAAMYNYIRAPSLKNPNPSVVGRERTITTSKQVTDYLLCAQCEHLFNKNGEKEVLKWVWNGREFPLADRLAVAHPHHQFGENVAFSAADLGIDANKFGYFALSVVWRGAVHEWDTVWGKSTVMDLGHAEDPIRRFLLEETGFPDEVAIIMSVCADIYSRGVFFMPSRVLNFQGTCFVLLTVGLHFMVFIGPETNAIREMCCVRSPRHLIYQRDCSKKTIEVYRDLVISRDAQKNKSL